MSDRPIPMRWDGSSFTPVNQYWAKQAAADYTAGEVHAIAPVQERSIGSHRHYFSCLREAWMNLPAAFAERFKDPEALRKFALVKAGYADERSIVCKSKAEAQRIAAFVKPMDAFSIVVVCEATVKVFTPQSQSMKAMGAKEFAESKRRVLDVVSQMLGVSVDTLAREGARSAA